MDIGTLVGIIGIYALLLWSILLGGSIIGYIDYASVLIVFGGGLGFLLVSHPFETIMKTFTVFMKALYLPALNPLKTVEILVEFSEKARREGILALENAVADIDDDFLKTGIRLAVDGLEPDKIKEILQTEMTFIEDRHKRQIAVFDDLGISFPAFGMIGTLVGLVAMLQNLSDPSSVGPPMAVALLTTLYGAVMCNAFAVPVATKLKIRNADEMLSREIAIEGIMAIQSGDNPRIVEQRLLAYLPPAIRPKREEKN